MFGEQRIRTLLGPADPARDDEVAPPRLTAHDLIALAGPAEPRRTPATRRLVLTAGAAIGVAVIVDRLTRPEDSTPSTGVVLVPIAYEFGTDAPDAGPRLRELADRLVDTPYEHSTGRFTYHHTKSWGRSQSFSADGRYSVGYSAETKLWWAYDATGHQITTPMAPEFPDRQSRRYWTRRLSPHDFEPYTYPVEPRSPAMVLPTDREELSKALDLIHGPASAFHETDKFYSRYAVPRQVRAEVLRILADLPGLAWRGTVTDRAGRTGVAITLDDRDRQLLLIFHPGTGELLAYEELSLNPAKLSSYTLILDTDRSDHIG